MDTTQLTSNEKWIIEALRSLRPFEEIKIVADALGNINNYLVIRTNKIMLKDNGLVHVK